MASKARVLIASTGFFLATSVVVLFISFFFNVFGVGYSSEWFAKYQQDSNVIVEKDAQCKEIFDVGPVFPVDKSRYSELMAPEGGCNVANFQPYASQFGLQARIIAFFAPTNDELLKNYFYRVEAVIAFLTAIVLTLFLWKVRNLFSARTAYIVLGLTSVSVWVVAFGRNLYWAPFLLFAPFVFSFTTYWWARRHKRLVYFYFALLILFLLKFLNGYEYTSTIVISAFIPILFYELYIGKLRQIRYLWKQALGIFVAGVIALVGAIAINVWGLTSYTGSAQASLSKIAERAESRAGGEGFRELQPHVLFGFEATSPEVYKAIDRVYDLDELKEGNANPLKYVALLMMGYLLLPVISIPIEFAEPIGSILQSFIVLVVIIVICLLTLRRRYGEKNSLTRSLIWSFGGGVIGALSWLILMPAHAYPHLHINGIIYFIPAMLIGYIIIALVIGGYKDGRHVR